MDHQLLVQGNPWDLCGKPMKVYISCNYHMPQNETVIHHVYLGSWNLPGWHLPLSLMDGWRSLEGCPINRQGLDDEVKMVPDCAKRGMDL